MPNKKNATLITVAVLFAIVAFVAGLFFAQHLPERKPMDRTQFHGTLLDKPREIRPFMLTGIDNRPFSNGNLQGQWTLFFFGFTHCASMCPTAMAELGKMYRLLDDNGVKPLPRVVMISLDPKRDTLETLGAYVKAFDIQFFGASGSEESIHAMTREMGIAYVKITDKGAENMKNYNIEHTGTVILLNPQGKLSAFFTMPHQAELLAKDYSLLIASNQGNIKP